MLENLMRILMSIKITDIIDISVVAYLLYVLLGYIKKTRAQQLFRGILLLIAFFPSSMMPFLFLRHRHFSVIVSLQRQAFEDSVDQCLCVFYTFFVLCHDIGVGSAC